MDGHREYTSMDMDISMDIHAKSVDMDMDVKFHIHGKPAHMAVNVKKFEEMLEAWSLADKVSF